MGINLLLCLISIYLCELSNRHRNELRCKYINISEKVNKCQYIYRSHNQTFQSSEIINFFSFNIVVMFTTIRLIRTKKTKCYYIGTIKTDNKNHSNVKSF